LSALSLCLAFWALADGVAYRELRSIMEGADVHEMAAVFD